MSRIRMFLICMITAAAFLLPQAVYAQQIYPAAGSLVDSEGGLWNYYKGKGRPTVKRNAPMFEKINESGDILLDHKKIKGVDLFLTAKFTKNKLSMLQITTPFPEHDKCNKDTKDLSRSFADVGYALMGVQFDAKKQCQQLKENGGSVVCTADDTICVYRLCPDESWALACSITGK